MINLVKGQKITVGHTNVTVGLGWTANDGTGNDFDLDCSVFMLNDQKKVIKEGNFVFYGNTQSPDNAVKHSGDNKTGAGDGDDEYVKIDITKLDLDVKELLFVVTIHEAIARNQNFGQVKDAYIRIINNDDNTEIAKFDLNEDFSIEMAVEFGRIYQKDGVWKFDASGIGYREQLTYFLSKYYDGPFNS
jgi:tellurium resistance protein TerD